MHCDLSQEVIAKADAIRVFACDVDGILSDGRIYISDSGQESKAFHVLDGQGLKLLQQAGIHLAVISSRESASVTHRMRALGIHHVFQGVADKLACLKALLLKLQIPLEQAAFMGDDLADLRVISRVGLGISVPNAVALVKQHSDWQTQNAGGHGAVREACEMILHAKQQYTELLKVYLPHE